MLAGARRRSSSKQFSKNVRCVDSLSPVALPESLAVSHHSNCIYFSGIVDSGSGRMIR